MTQQEMRERIKAKRKEAETAGAIHKKDLMREIHRLEKEMRTYCHYQNEARKRLPA